MSENEKPEVKDLLTAENLKKVFQGERPEQAYRRGYWEGTNALRYELGVLREEEKAQAFIDQLDTYMAYELILWKNGDISRAIPPPVFDSQKEREEKPAEEWSFDELRWYAVNGVHVLLAETIGKVDPNMSYRLGLFFGELSKQVARSRQIEQAAQEALNHLTHLDKLGAIGKYGEPTIEALRKALSKDEEH